jgi:hypothetical protein
MNTRAVCLVALLGAACGAREKDSAPGGGGPSTKTNLERYAGPCTGTLDVDGDGTIEHDLVYTYDGANRELSKAWQPRDTARIMTPTARLSTGSPTRIRAKGGDSRIR